jgi:hypothetical protein
MHVKQLAKPHQRKESLPCEPKYPDHLTLRLCSDGVPHAVVAAEIAIHRQGIDLIAGGGCLFSICSYVLLAAVALQFIHRVGWDHVFSVSWSLGGYFQFLFGSEQVDDGA